MQKQSTDDQKVRRRRASRAASVVFLPCLIIVSICLYHWYLDLQLDKTAKQTRGIVVRVEYDNHRNLDYDYSVDGTDYHGVGAILGNDSLNVGSPVQVTYDPGSPQTSALQPFGDTGSRPAPIFLTLAVGVIVFARVRAFLMGPDNPYDA